MGSLGLHQRSVCMSACRSYKGIVFEAGAPCREAAEFDQCVEAPTTMGEAGLLSRALCHPRVAPSGEGESTAVRARLQIGTRPSSLRGWRVIHHRSLPAARHLQEMVWGVDPVLSRADILPARRTSYPAACVGLSCFSA